MAKQNKRIKKINALHNILQKSSDRKKKSVFDEHILQRIIHPDYILFDWEYFSP